MKTDPAQTAHLSAFQDLIARDIPNRLYAALPHPVLVADAEDRRIIDANPAALEFLQLDTRRIRQLRIENLLPRADPERLTAVITAFWQSRRESMRAHLTTGLDRPHGVEVRLFRVDAKWPSLVVVLHDEGAVPLRLRRKLREDGLLRGAIEALPDGFVLFDADDRLVLHNKRYEEMFPRDAPPPRPGMTFETILRNAVAGGQFGEPGNGDEAIIADRLASHIAADEIIEQQLSNGRWLRILERPTADGGRVGLRIDITRTKAEQKHLEDIIRTDELTGLLNRRGVKDALLPLSASLAEGEHLVALHIDLDRFKLINDVYGYAAGDHVLGVVATRLRRNCAGDADCLIGRIGADEFLIMSKSTQSSESHLDFARAVIADLGRPTSFDGRNHRIGAGIGVVTWHHDKDGDLADLFTAADLAVHAAKAFGKDEAVLFHPDMREKADRTHDMAFEIQLGMSRGELLPFFQPQIDTRTGKVDGFEALIRWRHPTRGLVPAYEFLAVAQNAGLTEAIDELIMDKSCAAARQLMDWGLQDVRISINVSVPQISDPHIARRLRRYTDKHGIKPENLRIELLESTLLDERSTHIIRNVHDLIRQGYDIELDDFGTGHAAIATLRHFAVSRIKVDRSLVQHIDSDTELQVITSAIVNLAKSLGIDALAEGVETGAEQVKLDEIGFTCAQGYLHAKPMPLEELRSFLRARGQIS